MPASNIKIPYSKVANHELQFLLQKIISQPTTNKNACAIRRVWKEAEAHRKTIVSAFEQEIIEKFATRAEDGSIVRPEDQPNGFLPQEDKLDEYGKAQDEFGSREMIFESTPLNPTHLKDIQLSAKEIDILGDLFDENEGPGVPFGAYPGQ